MGDVFQCVVKKSVVSTNYWSRWLTTTSQCLYFQFLTDSSYKCCGFCFCFLFCFVFLTVKLPILPKFFTENKTKQNKKTTHTNKQTNTTTTTTTTNNNNNNNNSNKWQKQKHIFTAILSIWNKIAKFEFIIHDSR